MKNIITAILIGLCVAIAMPLEVQAGRNGKADRRERARREVVANCRGYYKDVFILYALLGFSFYRINNIFEMYIDKRYLNYVLKMEKFMT